jgi:hypothetical protein
VAYTLKAREAEDLDRNHLEEGTDASFDSELMYPRCGHAKIFQILRGKGKVHLMTTTQLQRDGAVTGPTQSWSAPHYDRFNPEKDTVPVIQEAGWASRPVWMCTENVAPTGIRSPDLPARRKSLYRVNNLNISLYGPGQAARTPGGWGLQISRQSAHESGKVVSPTHRPPLPPRKYSWYSFLLEAESTPEP